METIWPNRNFVALFQRYDAFEQLPLEAAGWLVRSLRSTCTSPSATSARRIFQVLTFGEELGHTIVFQCVPRYCSTRENMNADRLASLNNQNQVIDCDCIWKVRDHIRTDAAKLLSYENGLFGSSVQAEKNLFQRLMSRVIKFCFWNK